MREPRVARIDLRNVAQALNCPAGKSVSIPHARERNDQRQLVEGRLSFRRLERRRARPAGQDRGADEPAGRDSRSSRAGEEATALYLIKDGSVRIATHVAERGAHRCRDTCLGIALRRDGVARRCRSARPAPRRSKPTAIFRFDYDKIQSLLDASPPIASRFYRSLARFLSNRLRQTTTDMSFARERNLRHF